nr:hypothetical protein CFP56_13731 [Quercus suber]
MTCTKEEYSIFKKESSARTNTRHRVGSVPRQTRFYFPQNASELTQQLALQLRRSNSCRFLDASKILDLILTHSPESETSKF